MAHIDNIISAKPYTPVGGLLRGTKASVLPTDVATALDSTYIPLGYVTDKGVSLSSSVSTTDKKAWGGYVVRTLTQDTAVEVTFSLYEFLNADAIKAAYGEQNVILTPSASGVGNAVAVKFNGSLPEAVPYIIEAKDGEKRIRTVIPRLQIVDQGDLVFDDASTFDLNLKGKAYPDDSGNLWYTYVDTLATAPVAP